MNNVSEYHYLELDEDDRIIADVRAVLGMPDLVFENAIDTRCVSTDATITPEQIRALESPRIGCKVHTTRMGLTEIQFKKSRVVVDHVLRAGEIARYIAFAALVAALANFALAGRRSGLFHDFVYGIGEWIASIFS